MQSIDSSDSLYGDCYFILLSYVPPDLLICSNVWMRVNRIRKSLKVPYTGLYEVDEVVVLREPKYFALRLP